ncbi:16S rRNA (uracil(1498)-N(3))-methyltransferase [Saccharibacter sp. 17.LH.SD]|uniref:16S rRNA (uracil(1498)-N(3))-methyltransferase n=1 Tax=Saccharibacter sp. 17.LH.SD TaxID=2689393 RepID=UPI0013717D34|nr:16S rRNA (uracil(1498)-N(3))-methyltransferase [Saccharibacter sp. 17.LH.SD]MXV44534.1 16S rRNA (uracil(1498)-N(3))-methyltransferase [Saccharibacter sp. 17.LH.SD]
MSRTDPRLYCDYAGSGWTDGQEIPLSAGHAHYIGKVMRLQPGHEVRLFNGHDGEWQAAIVGLQRQGGGVRLVAQVRPQRETQGLELLFSPLKRDATELVIRMGTELGVTRFRPVVTARTNTHRLNLDRLRLIAQEAAEQCERLDVPELMPLEPLAAVLARWPSRRPLAVALERQGTGKAPSDCAAYLVGPEGGFSEEEVQRLRTHEAVKTFSLGALILRAETAVAAGLAQLTIL